MRVAAIQMVSARSMEKNFAAACDQLMQAREAGADIAALPENFLVFGTKHKPSPAEQQDFLQSMSQQAQKLGLWVVAGTYPLTRDALGGNLSAENKPFAASVVFNSEGEQQAAYAKIHLFDVDVGDNTRRYRESDDYAAGQEVVTVDTPWCRIGLTVCYDLRFPELFIELARRGAKVIFVPSAFTAVTGKAHWQVLLRARAIESQCYIVAPDQGGKHENGKETWGETMIVDPWGEVLSSLPSGEGCVIETLALNRIDEIRCQMPIQQHRRLYPT